MESDYLNQSEGRTCIPHLIGKALTLGEAAETRYARPDTGIVGHTCRLVLEKKAPWWAV